MPKQYTAIRDKLISEGKSEKQAERSAARIYNAAHPGAPLRRDDGNAKHSSSSTSKGKRR